jgi:hypothetical protein
MIKEGKMKSKNVTMPRYIFEKMAEDGDLIRHLAHYRGWGWVNAIKEEMKIDKKYKLGAFNGETSSRTGG